jgi:hypothetical protein
LAELTLVGRRRVDRGLMKQMHRNVRFRRAGPSGRCNTSIKSLGWDFEAQNFARPVIEQAE